MIFLRVPEWFWPTCHVPGFLYLFKTKVHAMPVSPIWYVYITWCVYITLNTRVKKCCHVWLDQNFNLSLLTKNLGLIFMGLKQKKIKSSDSKILANQKPLTNFHGTEAKKNQNGRLKITEIFKPSIIKNY